MSDGNLFPTRPGELEEWEIDRKALSRFSDPETSKEAARSVDLPKMQAKAYALVLLWPGKTARELGDGSVRKRLYNLLEMGLVRKGEVRRCSVTKRRAATWWAVCLGSSTSTKHGPECDLMRGNSGFYGRSCTCDPSVRRALEGGECG